MANDRAKQFSAFSPLKGYDELLRQKEKITVQKRELTDEYALELSQKLSEIEKGMMVEVIHYLNGEYLSTTGIVSKVDPCFKKITIVKMEIDFDDIYDVLIKKETLRK